MVVEEMEARG